VLRGKNAFYAPWKNTLYKLQCFETRADRRDTNPHPPPHPSSFPPHPLTITLEAIFLVELGPYQVLFHASNMDEHLNVNKAKAVTVNLTNKPVKKKNKNKKKTKTKTQTKKKKKKKKNNNNNNNKN